MDKQIGRQIINSTNQVKARGQEQVKGGNMPHALDQLNSVNGNIKTNSTNPSAGACQPGAASHNNCPAQANVE